MLHIFKNISNDTALVLLSLSAILLAGFLLTRLTKLARLPNVTGYILAGILIGPGVLDLVPESVVGHMGFVSDIALAFIAFGAGRFFTRKSLARGVRGVAVITLCESLTAGAAVMLCIRFIFGLPWSFCLLLGAVATATAPASTMVTVRQYRAEGEFVDTLLQVVALDDAVCLLIFSVAAAVVGAGEGEVNAGALTLTLLYNLAAPALGVLGGLLLGRLAPRRSEDNRLILTAALLLGVAGVCAAMGVSPLLACMALSAVYRNLSGDETLYGQVESFTPPLLSIFFVVSGMALDTGALVSLGAVGACYFLVRIAGKYLGAYLGCTLAHTGRGVRENLGLALAPQAGVAIGLAFLGRRILPEEAGDMLLGIILASSVLYELAGPVCAKLALVRSGAIRREPAAPQEPPSAQRHA